MPDLSGILRQAQALLSAGHPAKAIPHLEQAARLQPRNPAIFLSLGEARLAAGQTAGAAEAFFQSLQLDSKQPLAWCRLAAAHQQLGKTAQAAAAYQQAHNLDPAHAEIACNLGIALLQAGQATRAMNAFQHALARKPTLAEALNGMGVALTHEGRYAEAAKSLEQAAALRPGYADALFNLATALQADGRREEAVRIYRSIKNPGPLAPDVYNNMGMVLRQLRRFAEAIDAHRQAVALKPGFAEALNNLGNALLALHRYDEAREAFERALMIRPGFPAALHNLGNVLLADGRVDDAIGAFRSSYSNTPLPEAEYSEGLALLLKGDFAAGLPKYEKRWDMHLAGLQPGDLRTPRWQGEDPAGRTILLFSEQGLGDTLQFVRYAPLLAARGARVILYVHAPLKDLLASLPGVERIVPLGETIPPHDLHCPLLSLPLAFGTRLDSIPATIPYLSAPAERRERWKQRLSADGTPRIGLVCSGSPHHHNDHNRSIPLAAFKPLLDRKPGRFYLLQKELRPGDEATLAATPGITSLAAEIGDFADTAAIIENLDLLISVDTSIVHLAGALGRPVWTLLPAPPDWRWLLSRSDSPWYPGMRLFRQPAPGRWAPVLDAVAAALESHAG